MPTYEYQCKTCGHHFERVQRFSDDPIRECPECGAEVRRVIHPAGVIFKGAGWYITDSRKSGGDSASLSSANGNKGDGEATKSEPTKTDGGESKAADSPAKEPAAKAEKAASTSES